MKKVLAILIAVLMLGTLCVPAFAASDISADEQRVLDVLEEIATGHHGADMAIKAVDINQAKTFFMKDEINVDKATADEMLVHIEECFDIVVKSGLKEEDLSKMSTENKQALLAAANKAGAAVNVSVSYNATKNEVNFTYTNPTTNTPTVVATTAATIKVTGPDYTMLIVVLSAAVLAVAGLAVVVKKTARAK